MALTGLHRRIARRFRSRKPRARVVGVALLLLVAVACSGESTETTPGAVIVVGLKEDVSSLDPGDHRQRVNETVIRNMFDGLVTRDTESRVYLELAESIERVDETTVRITLREGVLFHDGVEMTADDVVFTFERLLEDDAIEYPEPHSSPRRGLLGPVVSVEKTGPYEVVLHANAPWPVMMQLLVHQQIVPKHYLEEVGTKGFIEHPIGTGPFAFVSGVPGGGDIVLERFDDYWGGASAIEPVGPACVDGVIFRSIPDPDERVAAVIAGEAHIIQAVPATAAGILDESPDVNLQVVPGTRPKWVDLNLGSPLFSDVRVRQALFHAINREVVSEEVYDGEAELLAAPLSPYNAFAHLSLPQYDFSPETALSLLAEAGWEDTDGDGVLEQGDVEFRFTLETYLELEPLARVVASMLEEIGVVADIVLSERPAIAERFLAGEGDAFVSDWGDSAFDPVGHFEAKWHTREEGTSYGRGNFSGYSNERVDQLIRLGEEQVERSARRAIYDEAQELIWEELPAIFLVLPPEMEASSASVSNWVPAMDGRINLHDVCLLDS